jgi:hypothetical protein
VLDQFLERRWIARLRDTRALRVTPRGTVALASLVREIARLTAPFRP